MELLYWTVKTRKQDGALACSVLLQYNTTDVPTHQENALTPYSSGGWEVQCQVWYMMTVFMLHMVAHPMLEGRKAREQGRAGFLFHRDPTHRAATCLCNNNLHLRMSAEPPMTQWLPKVPCSPHLQWGFSLQHPNSGGHTQASRMASEPSLG